MGLTDLGSILKLAPDIFLARQWARETGFVVRERIFFNIHLFPIGHTWE